MGTAEGEGGEMESRRGRGREEVTAEGGVSRRVKLGGGREEWEGRGREGGFLACSL